VWGSPRLGFGFRVLMDRPRHAWCIIAHHNRECKRAGAAWYTRRVTDLLGPILDACFTALSGRADELDAEHSVYGVDALKETQTHEIMAFGIRKAGLGLAQEAYYPSDDAPIDSARARCDLTVFERADASLLDPVHERREREREAQTLFGAALASCAIGENACAPEDAVWVEAKVAAQHACRDGVFRPNASYARELVDAPARDIERLASDERIWHGGALLVVFTETEQGFEHDTHAAVGQMVARGLPVRSPMTRSRAITDRAGNGCMGLALVPLRV